MGQLIGGLIGASGAKKQLKKARREVAVQAEESRRAAEAQKERQRIEQLRADVNTRKERQQQLREARIRRASLISQAVQGGGQFSSSIEGGLASINTQLRTNLGALSEAQGFAGEITQQNLLTTGAQQNILESQGRQSIFESKAESARQKGQLIGSAIDTGLKVATVGTGGGGGGGSSIQQLSQLGGRIF